MHLNQAQQNAISYTDDPLLIVAGAGTGKTTVITQKIVHLIKSGLAKPEEILALTFTDNAAGEMQERADMELDMGYVDMQISTFHAFCQKILETHGLDIGLSNQFKLFTQTDAWLLAREHIYDFELDYYRPMGNPTRHVQELLKHFSKCKDELISPEDYLEYAQGVVLDNDGMQSSVVKSKTNQKSEIKNQKFDEARRLNEIANAYHKYNQLLLDNNVLDFGDLIFYTVKLLQERSNILSALQKRFKYILVDEFQDVNWAQYVLVKLLTHSSVIASPDSHQGEAIPADKQRRKSDGVATSLPPVAPRNDRLGTQLTVVGDDDQSIYAFRGASVSNILRFKEDFPNAKEIVLTENYRSGQTILDGAYKLIQNNNPDRLETKLKITKQLQSEIKNLKSEICHLYFDSIDSEVAGVIKKISEIRAQKLVDWDDIVILVRANSHAEPFLNALEKAGIPYEFLASSGLYRQPIILDCFNFLKIVNSYHDSTAIYRLLRLPFFDFKESDLQKFTAGAKKKSISYYEALKRTGEFDLSKEGIATTEKLIALIHHGMKQAREEKPTAVLYNFLADSGYLNYLTREEESGNRKAIRSIHHLKQFLDFISRFEEAVPGAHVGNFIEHFSNILSSGDEGKLYQPTDTPDSVNIMTVHGAKGLEFKYVFVVNLVEDRFPGRKKSEGIEMPLALIKEKLPEGDSHYQEERRLFYVAMTRAKEYLYLTSAADYGGVRRKKISRFLSELGYGSKNAEEKEKKLEIGNWKLQEERKNAAERSPLVYELPKTFSFSQIRSYQTCPYQYKLAHILKIPVKGNASFSFGQTMHSTLQKFYQRVRELNNASQSSLFGAPEAVDSQNGITAPSFEDLGVMYEESWISDWYANKKQREDYLKEGKEILKIFYTAEEGKWTIPVALEGWFKIKVGDYLINGRIDRVDQLADGSLEIIDYKTGKSKEKLTVEDKDQLLIYQIAAQSLPEYKNIGPTGKLTFFYLNDSVKTSFIGKDKELEKIQAKILETIEGIRTNDFTATPSQFVCGHCDYRDICEHRA